MLTLNMRILLRQTKTLIKKTYLLLLRKWFTTLIRALLLPCGVMIFLSYAKYLFFPPQNFGFGDLAPMRSLSDTLDGKLVFVRGHIGKDADAIIKRFEENEGITDIIIAEYEDELSDICLMNLQGSSSCFAAVIFTDPVRSRMSFYDSATGRYREQKYNSTQYSYSYQIMVNPSLRTGMIDIENANSPIQTHIFPLQYAVDRAIAPDLPKQPPRQWGYTTTTAEIQEEYITEAYLRGMARYIYPGIFIGMIGIMYHLPGLFVAEREIGVTSLLDAHGCTTIARYLSWHISLSALYMPGWIIGSIFFAIQLFQHTNGAIVFFWQVLGGLSLTSYSIFLSSFFARAQLASVFCSTLAMVLVTVMVVITFGEGWTDSSPAIFIGMSAVFPPVNYVTFFSIMAGWESGSHGVDLLKTLNDVPDTEQEYNGPAAVKGIIYWVFALIHIFLFPILGAVVEHFFYSTKTNGLRVPLEVQEANGMAPLGIRLTNFTRKYKEFTAVDNLNLKVYQGQIMCLLGSNGSGKTTTLQAIAGIGGISSGKIEIAGLRGHRNSTLSGVGVCPQGNVLWDSLTVEEHVKLWAEIKCTDTHHFDDGDIISECDLWKKRKSKSGTLSGGQKRKLQLAIMLVGGVEVCCMDEVSSGLDPLSRLKIHEIILANRGQRTILFTTHFLDEADFLSDYIAIISRGKLQCDGSPATLKSKMGNGYKITTTTPIDEETEWIVHDSTQVAPTLRYIEERGVQDYKVEGPTLEEVFLNVIADAKTAEDESDGKNSRDSSDSGSFVSDSESEDRPLDLSRGQVLNFWREMSAIYGKRWMVIRRSFIPVLCVLFIPIVVAIATRGLLRNVEMDTCIRDDTSATKVKRDIDIEKRQLKGGVQTKLDFLKSSQVLLGPESFWTDVRVENLKAGLKEILPYEIPTTISSQLDDFTSKIESDYANLPLGLYFTGGTPESDIVAMNMEIPLYYSAAPLNFMNQLRLNESNAGISISTGVNTFSRADFTPEGLGWALIFIFFFGFSMALAAAFPTMYPTFERVRKVRALHYSNGVRPAPLWLGHLMYESMWLIASGIICAVIMATNIPGNWYQAWYLILIFILYGIAGTLFSFIISLFAKSALAAFPAMAGLNAIMHTVFTVVYMVLFTIGSAEKLISSLNGVFYGLGLIFPIVNLGRALFISLNMFGMSCKPASASSAGNAGLRPWAGAFDLYGGPICYLILQSIVFYGFLVWWENGRQVPIFMHKFITRKSKPFVHEDSFQMNSRASMANSPEKNSLVVDHINKRFGKNKAVDNVSFCVSRDETFCLLGPNGAGKTTTITMVLGEMVPDSGDIYVENKSIRKQRGEARTSLGVCPQFDAIDNLTVKQTLDFYARVKGVDDADRNVREIIRGVGLGQFVRRKVDNLSGGNKRKLSLGIALMGNPGVLLLDEPSSGMDAGAKRIMWKTLRAVSTGRAIVLTTHSMEESDALADRVGILGGRMLAMGTIEQLQESHGRYHHIHVVSANAPHSSTAEMVGIQQYIQEAFGETVGTGVLGQVRFKIPESVWRIGDVFAKLEQGREQVGIKEFAVAGTTLEDVFLSVSRRYEEEQAALQKEQ